MQTWRAVISWYNLPADAEKVGALMESIKDVGLIEPVWDGCILESFFHQKALKTLTGVRKLKDTLWASTTHADWHSACRGQVLWFLRLSQIWGLPPTAYPLSSFIRVWSLKFLNDMDLVHVPVCLLSFCLACNRPRKPGRGSTLQVFLDRAGFEHWLSPQACQRLGHEKILAKIRKANRSILQMHFRWT